MLTNEHIMLLVHSLCPWPAVASVGSNLNTNPGYMRRSEGYLLMECRQCKLLELLPWDGFKDIWTSGWSYCNIILYKADGIHLCFQIWKDVWARLQGSTNRADDLILEGKLSTFKQSLCLTLNVKSHPNYICVFNWENDFLCITVNQPTKQLTNQ